MNPEQLSTEAAGALDPFIVPGIDAEIRKLVDLAFKAGQSNSGACFDPFGGNRSRLAIEQRDKVLNMLRHNDELRRSERGT